MNLSHEEINSFYKEVKIHNSKFDIKDIKEYKLYYKPFGGKHQIFIRKFLNVSRFRFLCTAIAGWGLNERTIELFKYAKKKGVPFFFVEDGFIRSLYTYVADVDSSLRSGISYIVDTRGYHFDGNIETDLEILLNSYICTEQQKDYSRAVMNKIAVNKISKYNNQPIYYKDNIGEANKKVLIIDQSYGDMSLVRGGITDDVFETMIEDAINENPNCEILFKVHPDTIAKNKSTEFLNKLDGRVQLIDGLINPLVLLDMCEKVYVATSQMGFEALILGKEVHVYGTPFYAGWGLTKDRLCFERRKRVLSIEELFYIVYVVYSNYINPKDNVSCTIDEAIEYILKIRNLYFE